MQTLDYVVLGGYFVMMIVIGVVSAMRVKAQEDFFMGGRSFGKLLQTFAAFGAGTGSSDPVNTARTTFTSGMSGMWSVMYWLFVTPFYWITGVWYRRMRHLTLGDWFVERYESKAMGAAYCLFGLAFFMIYSSMLFSAIGKVAAPLLDTETVILAGQQIGIEYVLVPIIGVVVLVYGTAGGLRAAYYTDLVQGSCIIVLSIILIPYGLDALVQKFGDPATQGMMDGFQIMHEQMPKEHFTIVGSGAASEFPLHRIVAVVLINLVGIVVQPHFIATGGGSAKTETDARVGLVVGNFLKRFCTVGWALTALITLALFADRADLIQDPDKAWGIASREILGPINLGLVGLMLACLLAALMSTVDAQMVVGSGLVVRNIYAAYINPGASEREYILVARLTGVIVVGGAVIISLFMMDVFKQLQLTWIVPVLFAAPFWIGMYWRRATTAAAWLTVLFCATMFFLVPAFLPVFWPELRDDPRFTTTNDVVVTTTERLATPLDKEKRDTSIAIWTRGNAEAVSASQDYQAVLDEPTAGAGDLSSKQLKQSETALRRLIAARETLEQLGPEPMAIEVDDLFQETKTTGGKAVFWTGGVRPVDEEGNVLDDVKPQPVDQSRATDESEDNGKDDNGKDDNGKDDSTVQVMRYDEDVRLKGFGKFNLDFVLYQWLGMDLTTKTDATLSTLELPPKIVMPFVVMILLSLVTRRNSKEALDRYYAKMKTPVDPEPEADDRNLQDAYNDPGQFESRKLLPGTDFEFQRPTKTDVIGVIVCFAVCFAIIGLAIWVASIGA